MNYYEMYANTTSGALAPQQSSHSPYDSSGTFDSSLLPAGNTLLGSYDDSGNNDMPADFKTAYDNPQAWLYQGGAFVANPAWPAIQIQQAKQAQIASIEAGYGSTLGDGFKSNTTGHTYASDMLSSMRVAAQVTQLLNDTTITTVNWQTNDAGEISHTRNQFIGVFNDGIAWERAQVNQKNSLIVQVQAQTSVPPTPVTWSEVNY